VQVDRPSPTNIRSSLMLETLAEMIRPRSFAASITRIEMSRPGDEAPAHVAVGSDAVGLVPLVARGEIDVSTLNPSGILTAAYLGTGPFPEAYPLRAVAVIPSRDWMAFAVSKSCGLRSLADIKAKRFPLRVSVRADRTNVTHLYIHEVLKAYGFSLDDVVSWGGSVSYDPGVPFMPERAGRARAGEVDAIFDEGVTRFIPMLDELNMELLPVDEDVLAKMDALGLHRATLPRALFPNLPVDVPTLDFSGWPVYTSVHASDDFIYEFCRALDVRRAHIIWQQPGPLPIGDMCRDTPSAPLRIPLHPAAERYWTDAGYL